MCGVLRCIFWHYCTKMYHYFRPEIIVNMESCDIGKFFTHPKISSRQKIVAATCLLLLRVTYANSRPRIGCSNCSTVSQRDSYSASNSTHHLYCSRWPGIQGNCPDISVRSHALTWNPYVQRRHCWHPPASSWNTLSNVAHNQRCKNVLTLFSVFNN